MVMRSISWLRPSTLLRKRGADDLDIGMGIRMVLGIGDCTTQTHTHTDEVNTDSTPDLHFHLQGEDRYLKLTFNAF